VVYPQGGGERDPVERRKKDNFLRHRVEAKGFTGGKKRDEAKSEEAAAEKRKKNSSQHHS